MHIQVPLSPTINAQLPTSQEDRGKRLWGSGVISAHTLSAHTLSAHTLSAHTLSAHTLTQTTFGVYLCTRMCVHTYMWVYMCAHIHVSVYVYTHTCTHIPVCKCECKHVYTVCMHICAYTTSQRLLHRGAIVTNYTPLPILLRVYICAHMYVCIW